VFNPTYTIRRDCLPFSDGRPLRMSKDAVPADSPSMFLVPRPERSLSLAACILVYGSDLTLLETRKMVLERAGYETLMASTGVDAEKIMLRRTVSVLVLCHTLSTEKCEAIVEFAEHQRPSVSILTLTAGASSCANQANDVVLSTFKGPQLLVETVQALCMNAP
jgi:hypothetical protein